jgi:hypothetical protein
VNASLTVPVHISEILSSDIPSLQQIKHDYMSLQEEESDVKSRITRVQAMLKSLEDDSRRVLVKKRELEHRMWQEWETVVLSQDRPAADTQPSISSATSFGERASSSDAALSAVLLDSPQASLRAKGNVQLAPIKTVPAPAASRITDPKSDAALLLKAPSKSRTPALPQVRYAVLVSLFQAVNLVNPDVTFDDYSAVNPLFDVRVDPLSDSLSYSVVSSVDMKSLAIPPNDVVFNEMPEYLNSKMLCKFGHCGVCLDPGCEALHLVPTSALDPNSDVILQIIQDKTKAELSPRERAQTLMKALVAAPASHIIWAAYLHAMADIQFDGLLALCYKSLRKLLETSFSTACYLVPSVLNMKSAQSDSAEAEQLRCFLLETFPVQYLIYTRVSALSAGFLDDFSVFLGDGGANFTSWTDQEIAWAFLVYAQLLVCQTGSGLPEKVKVDSFPMQVPDLGAYIRVADVVRHPDMLRRIHTVCQSAVSVISALRSPVYKSMLWCVMAPFISYMPFTSGLELLLRDDTLLKQSPPAWAVWLHGRRAPPSVWNAVRRRFFTNRGDRAWIDASDPRRALLWRKTFV